MTPLQRRTTIDRLLNIEVEVKEQEHGALRQFLHDGFTGFRNMSDHMLAAHAVAHDVEILPTDEQTTRLRDFANHYGRNWKEDLLNLWLAGRDASLADGHLLRQVRNNLGPKWLQTVDTVELVP